MKKKLLIAAVITFIVAAIGIHFQNTANTVYIQDEVVEVVELDHFDKLTKNLNEKLHAEQDSSKVVERAHAALEKAVELNDIDRENLNKAVEAINTYQGM